MHPLTENWMAGAAQTLGGILEPRLRLRDLGQVYIDLLVWGYGRADGG